LYNNNDNNKNPNTVVNYCDSGEEAESPFGKGTILFFFFFYIALGGWGSPDTQVIAVSAAHTCCCCCCGGGGGIAWDEMRICFVGTCHPMFSMPLDLSCGGTNHYCTKMIFPGRKSLD